MRSQRRPHKEKAPPKSKEELQRDYERVCQAIGDRVYRIDAYQKEIAELTALAARIQQQASSVTEAAKGGNQH